MGKKSLYKGVYFNIASQAWQTFLHVDGKKQKFGYYDTEEQAANAYDWCVSDSLCALRFGRAS